MAASRVAVGRASKADGDTGGRIKKEGARSVYEVNQNWTAVCRTIAKELLKYLNESEALKSKHQKDLKEQVLSPNEPRRSHGTHREAGEM